MNGKLDLPKHLYHQDTKHVSHSALEVFRKSIPLYHGIYVKQNLPRPEPSSEMILGTAFHTMLLEPEIFDKEFSVLPQKIDRRTKLGKETYEDFLRKSINKSVLNWEDYHVLCRMRNSVCDNELACYFLDSKGVVEDTYQWHCPETTIPCKVRLDKLCNVLGSPGDEHVILDVKTARDATPKGFTRDAFDYGYHRQQWWYQWGLKEATGIQAKFVFLVVGKSPPYEVCFYEMPEEALDVAYRQVVNDMSELLACRETGIWVGRYADCVSQLKMPRWAVELP